MWAGGAGRGVESAQAFSPVPACLLSHLSAVKNPLVIFISTVFPPEVCSVWLESSLFKSLELGGGGVHAHTHTRAGGKVTASQRRGYSYCANPRENSGEGEQRCAMLLTWQPSRHAKRVMRTDSTEI